MNAIVNPTAKPVQASFPVRRMGFKFQDVPRYWAGNDAGITHFLTSLSVLFPEGEGFFVDSVRAVRNHPELLADQAMQKEISAFIGQEAMHSKEHEAFNASAKLYGYEVEKMERSTKTVITSITRLFQPFVKKEFIDLAGTCALEHFTATIAAQLLRRHDIQDLMQDPTMLQLWLWHAVEENEHKAVCYDVYQRIYGKNVATYAMRATAMAAAMVVLFFVQNYFMFRLMKQDGKAAPRHWLCAVRTLYGPKGFISQIIPELLDYFRPGFHPNDHDTVALLAKWTDQLGLNDPAYSPARKAA